ncbi:MAG: hypothetical protein WKF67_01555 [Rubrobacteraceae bacterium]
MKAGSTLFATLAPARTTSVASVLEEGRIDECLLANLRSRTRLPSQEA